MIRMGESGPAEGRSNVPDPRDGPTRKIDTPPRASPDGHLLPLDRPFDADSLSRLRADVAAHAAAAGLPADRVQDAVIAAHELAANAVHHGAGHGRVRQWTDGQLLCCHVSDPGPARPTTGGTENQEPWPEEYGHGLWLVSQTADHVIVDHHPGNGTDITISFAIGHE